MEIEKIEITPEQAKSILRKNNSNRRLRVETVTRYAIDMSKGKWNESTAECIKLASDGTLLDGQHRLHAIVEANVPIKLLVAYNVPKDVFNVIDTGVPRSGEDVLHVKGVPNASGVASVIKYFLSCKDFYIRGRKHNSKITNEMIYEEYISRPDYWNEIFKSSIRRYNQCARIVTPKILGTFKALFDKSPEHSNKSEDFMNAFCTGSTTNKAILTLRRTLTLNKVSKKKLQPKHVQALFIKCWNLFVLNSSSNLSYKPDIEGQPTLL